jgi:transcriptional regulator with XRE-family HTH domain
VKLKRTELIKFRGDKSQADMAKRYNVSQQAWSSWENGEKRPDVTIMKQIEVDSGIPMEVIFFDVFNNEPLSNAAQ